LFSLVPSTGGLFTAGAKFARDNSPIYELGVTAGYRFAPHMEVRVGYRRISIADAMLASDYAAAATTQSNNSAVPNTRRLNLDMMTVGGRFEFP
jgi:hypothetical protein